MQDDGGTVERQVGSSWRSLPLSAGDYGSIDSPVDILGLAYVPSVRTKGQGAVLGNFFKHCLFPPSTQFVLSINKIPRLST
jgi:hypothetical protein